MATLEHLRHCAQVFDSSVGARSDEHGVDRNIPKRHTGVETHVGERLLGCLTLALVDDQFGIRHTVAERRTLSRIGSPT